MLAGSEDVKEKAAALLVNVDALRRGPADPAPPAGPHAQGMPRAYSCTVIEDAIHSHTAYMLAVHRLTA